MTGSAWGLVGVAVTAICYGVATVLQAVAVRQAPRAEGLDARMLASVLGKLPYLVSLVLDGVGFVASILALRTLPLFLVQTAVASSVGVTALVSVKFLGGRLGAVELTALAGLGVGLTLLAASAQPGGGHPLSTTGRWLLLAGVAVVLVAIVAAFRLGDRLASAVLAAAAGAAFGGVGIAARVIAVPHPIWHMLADPLAWSIVLYGVLGMVGLALALQRGAVTTAAAVTFSVETLLPSAIGLVFLGDAAKSGFAAVAAAGFVLSLGGAICLARFAEPEPQNDRERTITG